MEPFNIVVATAFLTLLSLYLYLSNMMCFETNKKIW